MIHACWKSISKDLAVNQSTRKQRECSTVATLPRGSAYCKDYANSATNNAEVVEKQLRNWRNNKNLSRYFTGEAGKQKLDNNNNKQGNDP